MEQREDDKEIMELALQAGHILLENGAEIFRVEETMDRICRHYGLESGSAFVLSNGIFATAGDKKEHFFAKVQHIPVSGAHLDRVAAVNQLSREIAQGRYTPAQARQYEAEGQFAPGSMLPKVKAAVKFAKARPGRRAIISSLHKAVEAVEAGAPPQPASIPMAITEASSSASFFFIFVFLL